MARKTWQGWSRGAVQFITQCNHGCILMIPDENNHPVTSFMDAFFMNCTEAREDLSKDILDILRDTFNTYSEVWNDDSHRKMTRDMLLGIGTNIILGNVNVLGFARDIAYAVVMLESYDGSGDIGSTINSRVLESKYRDLLCGGSGSVRDVLKIFRKRLSCSCLKKMHLEARRTAPKMGACYNCGQIKERVLLMVCSKCRIAHYCSRECQIAAWSVHRGHCDICVKAHQRRRQHGLSN